MMRHEDGLQQRRRPGRNGRTGLVYAGIDTHADTHHVAVIDVHGRAVDDVRVEATARGYCEVVRFLSRWAGVLLVGVECTGSYGAGVTRALIEAGYDVREVNRPNRFDRRAVVNRRLRRLLRRRSGPVRAGHRGAEGWRRAR